MERGDGATRQAGASWPSAAPTPKPGGGPFPADGVIPFIKPLYSYSWVAGLLTAFLLYYALSVLFPVHRGEQPRPAVAGTGSAG